MLRQATPREIAAIARRRSGARGGATARDTSFFCKTSQKCSIFFIIVVINCQNFSENMGFFNVFERFFTVFVFDFLNFESRGRGRVSTLQRFEKVQHK